MNKLLAFFVVLVSSIILYVAVFSVVQRPLTLGDLTQQLDFKLAYAGKLRPPKVIIFAGSNGRYSHRCEQFSAVLDRPCVNASIASGVGIDFLLDQYGAVLQRGDLLYMPLEYGQYAVTEQEMHGGVQNAVMLRHRRDYLWSLSARRIVATYGSFDMPFLIRGVAEMGLARVSFRRRTGIDTLTEQGDERGHTAEKGAAYGEYLTRAQSPETHVPVSSYAEDVLSAFLVDTKRKGIAVVGGLPTIPDGTPIAEDDLERIRKLYQDHGQYFVSAATRSRYPRSCFYDTTYHLNETCQVQHSLAVAELLRAQLRLTPQTP